MLKKHKTNKPLLYPIIFMMVSFLLITACSDDSSQRSLDRYIAELKHKVAYKKTSQLSELFKMPETITYQREKYRSPFDTNEAISVNKSENPLQRYSLSMLHFIGTLTDNNIIYAYILAPDNKVYPVKLGDMLGDHLGVITNVDVDRIEVLERVNEAGKPAVQRIITLQLKDET